MTTEAYLEKHTSTALHDEKGIHTAVQEISQLLIQRLIPKEDRSNAVNQSLLQELISSCVLLPTIDAICEPDFINQYIITCLKTAAAAAEALDDQPLVAKISDTASSKQTISSSLISQGLHRLTFRNRTNEHRGYR